MSDSITIKEGGASRAFGPVSRLRVLKQGTGTEDFVPESATSETTKNITENGTYFAMQDNAYGYSQVTVNCSHEADSLTGKKQDGNEYTVSRDGDGNIQEDKVPSALLIVLAPLKNAYNDGETIDLTGIVAVAVDGNDQPWTGGGRYPDGIIPASELILPVDTAHYDESYGDFYVATSDLIPSGVNCGKTVSFTDAYGDTQTVRFKSGDGIMSGYKSQYGVGTYLAASDSPGAVIGWGGENILLNQQYQNNGLTVYYIRVVDSNVRSQTIPDGGGVISSNTSQCAWTMIYGELVLLPTQQDVVVQWRRPGDGKTLSDEFAILVSKIA